jgi:hypothetical protein
MKHSFGRTIAKALLVSTLFGTASVASVANAAVGTFPSSTFSSLDYGLYWFGDADNYQKAIPNQSNAYYSASKPTIIYIHGWQKGSSKALNRESFNRKDAGGPDLDLAYAWRQAGYNVGIMYWNQFADEDEVKDAEAKFGQPQARVLCAGVTMLVFTPTAPLNQLLTYYFKATKTT